MKDSCHDIAPLLAELAEDPDGPVADPRAAATSPNAAAASAACVFSGKCTACCEPAPISLCGRAPESLRERLTAQAAAGQAGKSRWAPLRMPVAATVLLAFLGVMTYGLTSASSTVLAAQLALDHLKCARLISPGTTIDPVQAVKEWAQQYDWSPRIPAPSPARKASLVGVRRCLYGHGTWRTCCTTSTGTVVAPSRISARLASGGGPLGRAHERPDAAWSKRS